MDKFNLITKYFHTKKISIILIILFVAGITRTGSLSADWKAGKKYTYSFDLATDITFSVNVSQWTSTNVNDTPIEII